MEGLIQLPFVKAFLQMVANCTDFKGRTGRKDFWWAVLCLVIIGCIAGFILGFLGGLTGLGIFKLLARVVGLGLNLLSIAMYVRRLHDTNKSGLLLLLCFTIVGAIPVLIWLIQEGDANDNKYGPVPHSIT